MEIRNELYSSLNSTDKFNELCEMFYSSVYFPQYREFLDFLDFIDFYDKDKGIDIYFCNDFELDEGTLKAEESEKCVLIYRFKIKFERKKGRNYIIELTEYEIRNNVYNTPVSENYFIEYLINVSRFDSSDFHLWKYLESMLRLFKRSKILKKVKNEKCD